MAKYDVSPKTYQCVSLEMVHHVSSNINNCRMLILTCIYHIAYIFCILLHIMGQNKWHIYLIGIYSVDDLVVSQLITYNTPFVRFFNGTFTIEQNWNSIQITYNAYNTPSASVGVLWKHSRLLLHLKSGKR